MREDKSKKIKDKSMEGFLSEFASEIPAPWGGVEGGEMMLWVRWSDSLPKNPCLLPRRLRRGRGSSFILCPLSFQQGFTLLEMIISIGVFSALVIASIGITIGVSNAQIKASTAQAAQDNIRFGVELMTKEMRTGSQYDASGFCGAASGEAIRFTASNGETRAYYRSGAALMRLAAGADCAAASPLLSDEVAVSHLRFQIGGEAPGATDGQPWAHVSLSLRSVGPKPVLDSQMDLQTMVVQRFRDQ